MAALRDTTVSAVMKEAAKEWLERYQDGKKSERHFGRGAGLGGNALLRSSRERSPRTVPPALDLISTPSIAGD
ncbi:hypothetical protein XI00_26370 [Bradyrhizobium sp. CCBAU 21359]|nr:hypothetical protein [Bradyrhizobium sp. CCBAU 21360]MDA9457699.1 hypothetical protein [Bradyrhizobium sp. CCBAU 21359]